MAGGWRCMATQRRYSYKPHTLRSYPLFLDVTKLEDAGQYAGHGQFRPDQDSHGDLHRAGLVASLRHANWRSGGGGALAGGRRRMAGQWFGSLFGSRKSLGCILNHWRMDIAN